MNHFKTILLAWVAGLAICTSPVLAQSNNVQYGPVLKDKGKTRTTLILGSGKSGYYTLRSELTSYTALMNSSENIALEHYNNNNELVFSKPLPLLMPGEKKPNNLENVFLVKNELYLFTSKLNEPKGKYIVYATKLDANGEITGKTVEVAESEPKTKKQLAYIDIAISPDNSNILVLESLKSQEAKFKITVLNTDLKQVYQEVVSKMLPANVFMKGNEIDNAGNVYIYHTSFKTSLNEVLTSPVHQFLVYAPAKKQLNQYNVTLPGKIVSDLHFKIDKNGKLAIAGLYANKHPKYRSGTFFMRLDPTDPKFQAFNTYAFSPEILAAFNSKSKDDNEGIANMKLDKLLLRDDGSAVLAAEQAGMYQKTMVDQSGRTSRGSEQYENKDILIINMNQEGKTEWVTRIPKLQHAPFDNREFNGYMVSTKGDMIYVIYNDHIKNANQYDPGQLKVMNNASAAVPMLVTIEKTGKFQKAPLEIAKDKNLPLQPRQYLANHETFLIYGKEGSNYRFANISQN